MTTEALNGIARLYGTETLAHFQQAHVCVIGVGGVGSWAVEALARSGIGTLTLIDLDDICWSNTNRQIQALSTTVGQMKVDALAERCKLINPEIQVNCVYDFVTPDNVGTVLPTCDFVIDAIDSLKPKVELVNYLVRHKIKFISTGGAGGQIDPTRVKVVDLAETIQDPLAAKLRQRLRKEKGFPKAPKKMKVPMVFSDEVLRYPQPDGTACAVKNLSNGTNLNCEGGFGSVTMVTGTFGFVAAAYALEKLMSRQ